METRGPGYLIADEDVLLPNSPLGHMVEGIRRALIGRRLRTAEEIRERVGVLQGLAVFASDNISSSAYATEEIMRVLLLAGAGALALTMPITVATTVIHRLSRMPPEISLQRLMKSGGKNAAKNRAPRGRPSQTRVQFTSVVPNASTR